MTDMAGAMNINNAINYCHNMAAGGNYRVPLKVCTQVMLSGVRKCFQQQQSPDGKAWAPLKVLTVKGRRKGKGPRRKGAQILRDTGVLMASATANMAPGAVRVLTDRVSVVGSNVMYAGFHQDGTKFITARPFIGHRPENSQEGGTYQKVFLDFESKRASGDGR
jgi:phage virion morphogenesis protein